MRTFQLMVFVFLSSLAAFGQNSNPYEVFGHKTTVKYESKVSDLLYILNKDVNSEIKAMAFDMQHNTVSLLGLNDTLLQKLDIEPDQILRWFSVDPLASKYPDMTPYNFVGNSPLRAVDPDGRDIHILFYTTGNKRGDEMFRASALTRKNDIERSKGFDPSRDKVALIAIKDMASIHKQVHNIVKTLSPQYGQTAELGIWSHAALQGPIGTTPTSSNAIVGNQMTIEGWGKTNYNWKNNGTGAIANFYGCRTGVNSYATDGGSGLTQTWKEKGSFANQISTLPNFENVMVSGQSSSAFPSLFTNTRVSSENGPENFINSEHKGGVNFQRTYLVGGNKRSEDWNMNEQNVANPMQNNINGQTTGTSFQSGTKSK